MVIAVLDAGSMLLDCLAAVDPNDERWEVILVDNGSVDDAASRAATLYPRISVIRNETNLGFATGSNQGAAVATGRYLLFLNTDALLPERGLERLVDTADGEPAAALWQPVIVTTTGRVETAGESFTWSGFFPRVQDLPPRDAPPRSAFTCTAACLLVRRGVFEALRGFHDGYFAYMEDLDLCWRARLAGWDVRVVSGVRVVHQKSQTALRILPEHEYRFISYRNRSRTILANGSATTLARMLPTFCGVSIAAALALVVMGRWKRSWAIVRALAWPLANLGDVARQRRAAQSVRVKSESEVLRPDLRTRVLSMEGWRMLRAYFAN